VTLGIFATVKYPNCPVVAPKTKTFLEDKYYPLPKERFIERVPK